MEGKPSHLCYHAALISGRALNVSRCTQVVRFAHVFLFALLCVHFSLLYQIDDCAGNACASDEQRPSARSILIMQGALNNQDNAMPSEYAKLMPNHNETTVVDVEVAFEMWERQTLYFALCALRQQIIRSSFFILTRSCRSYHPSMDEVDLTFANRRNFLTPPHGKQGWHAAAGAFDYRHYIFHEALLCWNTQTRVCPRGTSQFPWDGTKRNMDFPAVSPQLFPRQGSNFLFKFIFVCA